MCRKLEENSEPNAAIIFFVECISHQNIDIWILIKLYKYTANWFFPTSSAYTYYLVKLVQIPASQSLLNITINAVTLIILLHFFGLRSLNRESKSIQQVKQESVDMKMLLFEKNGQGWKMQERKLNSSNLLQ